MLRWVGRMMFALAVLAVGATEAAARRGFIPIPTFGLGGEAIVKVLDLPDIPQLRRADGRHMDLGYKFSGSSGEWVGYIGSDSQYLALPTGAAENLAKLAGLDDLPPVPDKPFVGSWGFVDWVYVVLAIGGASFWALKKFLAREPRVEPAAKATVAASDAAMTAAIERAQMKRATAPVAARPAAARTPAVARGPTLPAGRMALAGGGRVAQPAFGRRG